MTNQTLEEKVQLLENAERWVKNKIAEVGYTIEGNKNIRLNSTVLSKREALESFYLEYSSEYREINRQLSKSDKIVAITKELLSIALEKVISARWNKFLEDKNIELSFDNSLQMKPLEEFIYACTGNASKVDVYALAHWIWQVKRKMTGLVVHNHLMMVLYGKQGSGKSTAVDLLLKPVSSYKIDMSVGSLTDERNYHTLEEHFVVLCDEMHGCAKADIENLKQVITATSISARMLYTNTRDRLSQNCSFIGTSNKSLDLIIRDDTGMRRFYSLDCLDKIDWAKLNSIDPVSLWECVDVTKEDGYLCDVMTEISRIQEEYRHKDSVESYFEETKAHDGNETEQTSVFDIYADYSFWCEESGFKPVDKNYFSKQAKRLGIQTTRTAKARYLLISKSFVKHSVLRQGLQEDAHP